MSNYVKITDYSAKDALLTGNPAKLVKGAEIGADFDAVSVAVATKADIDGASITNVTADINAGTIDGTVIGGTSSAAGTFTTATATTGNITTVNATTVDSTNLEVTNLKAKDGTAAGSIADVTGVVTLASSVLATTDINGGTIDGAVIGGSSAAAGTFTSITSTGNATLGDDPATDTHTINGGVVIKNTGSGNCLLIEDSASTDATPFVVDANGIIRSGDQTTPSGFTPLCAVLSTDTAAGDILVVRKSNTGSNAPGVAFAKSRNTAASPTVVASGDRMLAITASGFDGANYIQGANIYAEVDGTPGTNDMPGRLVLSTTKDGASSPTEAMRIDSAQRVGIGSAANAGETVRVHKNVTGAATAIATINYSPIQSDVTNNFFGFYSQTATQAAAFTLSNLNHFYAEHQSTGAGSAITNQYGFTASSALTGATNNYGFYGNIAAGTGRWNFYANGTAANYFGGLVDISGASAGQIKFPATQNASADANTLDDYREASATLTATGMTTAPTGTATFVKTGNMVVAEIPTISGTSNATDFTLTGIPTAFRPIGARNVLGRSVDNGGAISVCLLRIQTDGSITIYRDTNGAAFTASGTKSVNGINVSYYT